MYTRTYSSSCSIRDMVSFVRVCRVNIRGCWQIIAEISIRFELVGRLPSLGIIVDGPKIGQLFSSTQKCGSKDTYHQLSMTIDPFGMNIPSYQSSSLVLWCIPILFGGLILSSSLTIALIYGNCASSSQLG